MLEVKTYTCSRCKKKVFDSDYHYIDENEVLCNECAFILGKADQEFFLRSIGFDPKIFKATVYEQNIYVANHNEKFEFEHTNPKFRTSISNKITLCESCHRQVHSKKRVI